MVFGEAYARLYDAMYQNKDYAHEVAAIHALIKKYRPGSASILDYGCGTGNHACGLLDLGYRYIGIDLNPNMLAIAQEKLAVYSPLLLEPSQADQVPAGSVDCVVCLFDVICYMNSNAELKEFLACCERVLAPGGLLILDFWYGPGVVTLGPENRWKEWTSGALKILRLATPVHNWEDSTVEVTFEVLVLEDDRLQDRIVETHTMRYFFKPELELLLDIHGFELKSLGTWADPATPPATNDWSALMVAEKRTQ